MQIGDANERLLEILGLDTDGIKHGARSGAFVTSNKMLEKGCREAVDLFFPIAEMLPRNTRVGKSREF